MSKFFSNASIYPADKYVYVRMYVCTYVLYVCMYVCMYACTYVCACVRTCVGMYACMHVCMYVCMHVCKPHFCINFAGCLNVLLTYDMSGKPHVNIYVKLLDVVTLSKALCPTIVNGNYECPFTH